MRTLSAIAIARRVPLALLRPSLLPRPRRVWTPGPLPGASSSALDAAADAARAEAFVRERGYSEEVSRGVIKALSAPDWGGASPLALATRMAGAWEVGEDAGLRDLAMSVERELAKNAGRSLVAFAVTPARGGEPISCEGYEGMSLKDVSEHGEGDGAALLADLLECACSGVMACSTCHVHVHPEWMDAVGEPSEAEEDMLDLAFDRRDNSRLGCQLVLTPELDGLPITIPSGANNLFDFIPFEDR